MKEDISLDENTWATSPTGEYNKVSSKDLKSTEIEETSNQEPTSPVIEKFTVFIDTKTLPSRISFGIDAQKMKLHLERTELNKKFLER